MNTDEIRSRVRAVLATVLNANPQTLADNASQTNLSAWDSLTHMNVVIALENEFDIEFEAAELQTLTTLLLLVAAIEKHTGGFTSTPC